MEWAILNFCINEHLADGFEFKVNGNTVEPEETDLGFMTVKINENTTTVDIVYHSPFIKYILLGILAGGLLTAAMIFAFKYYTKIKKLFERGAVIAADVLAVGIFGFGFVFPFILFLIKCVMALFKL